MTDIKKIKRTGGPRPGTPSPLRGRPSPLRGRQLPHVWRSGPDPDHHRLWRKFLVAKNQARWWRQAWSVSWEVYRDTMLPHVNNMGRKKTSWNLTRIRAGAWSNDNVMAAQRQDVLEQKKAGPRNYLPPLELARRREVMEKYKQRGYTGKRYHRYDDTDTK
jgi:hypothetical protein